ncbi:unnamed protein product, partial [Iphiclides podalirius]
MFTSLTPTKTCTANLSISSHCYCYRCGDSPLPHQSYSDTTASAFPLEPNSTYASTGEPVHTFPHISIG